MFYYQAVAPDLITLLKELFALKELESFRLVGGTSLALQMGHRKSVDLALFIEEIKVDFLNWHIPFLFPAINEDGLRLVDKREIAAMKMEAITGRKERKDFTDIAFLFKEYSLKELLGVFNKRYPFLTHTFVLESLMTADYTDESTIPQMLVAQEWDDIKKTITDTVEQYFWEQQQEIENQKQERIRKAEELLKQKKKDS